MIKRKILLKLQEHLMSDQMTIITGPRQVGKTYLMSLLQKQLHSEGKKTIWLNLDNEEDKQKLTSQAHLLAFIKLQVGTEKTTIFIDEIQKKENAGLFLKGIFDMNTPYKFIVSGSGSLELKAKISESMAGRKQCFTVGPISFEEFVNFKTHYQYEDKLMDFFKIEEEKTARLLTEYMVFGGYPRVILSETASQKQSQMREIYRSYVDRDIHDLLHLEKTDAFSNLLKILASQIGGLTNISELASTIGINVKTIKLYLFYLEQTFIIQKVTPFFRNTRSEITKSPIYYFTDIGLRNWLLGLFGLPEIPLALSGHLFENLIFTLLKNQIELSPTQIHFWRTKDQAEVDFILEKGLEVAPVEIKYAKLLAVEASRSLRSFIARYKPKNSYIVHTGKGEGSTIVGDTTIQLVSYYTLIATMLDI